MTTLVLATEQGPITVSEAPDGWTSTPASDLGSTLCIAVDPLKRPRIFCGTALKGVWRSDDQGRSWKRIFAGIPHQQITSLALSSAERTSDCSVVYAGTEPSGLFRSEDGGETWAAGGDVSELPSSSEWSFPPRPQTHHVRWIEPDPRRPGRLHVAIEAGALICSEDGGATWRDRVPGGPFDTHQLATHRDAPGRLWSAAGDGFFESNDAGQTWSRVERGLRHRYCWSLAVDAREPGIAILSAAAGPRQAHDASSAEAHLYRRHEGAESWQETHDGLPDGKGVRAYVLAADRLKPGVFYAAADGALYRSTDRGERWRLLPVHWPAEYSVGRIHAMAAA